MKKLSRQQIPLLAAAIVLLAAIAFIISPTGESQPARYDITATVANADGLRRGARVRMSGIVIGKVESVSLRPDYSVDITMRVGGRWKIPNDSALAVYSANFLGTKYIEVLPGGSDSYMASGSRFEFASGSVNIPEIIIMGLESFAGK